MMAAAREWLTSIVVVTLLLSVVQMLLPDGTLRKIGSFTGGLVLLVALLQPLLGADLERLRLDLEDYTASIEERREELEADSHGELAALIESRTAAYISEQAQRMGIQAEAAVKTQLGADGVPVPAEAEITGEWSAELSRWIASELGISEERQVWHERKDKN